MCKRTLRRCTTLRAVRASLHADPVPISLRVLTIPPLGLVACASLSGSLAGLLGFTGALGFAFYLVTTLLVGAAFSLTRAHARPGEYFDKGAWETVLGGEALLGNAAPFVLFWTREFGEGQGRAAHEKLTCING